MAESSDQAGSHRISLNMNINMNPTERARMQLQESLSRLVDYEMLPDIASHQNITGDRRHDPGIFSFGGSDPRSYGQGPGFPQGHASVESPTSSLDPGNSHGRYHPYSNIGHAHGHSHNRLSLSGRENGRSSPESILDTSGGANSFVINIGGDGALHRALGPENADQHGHSHSSIPDENQNTTGNHGHTENGQSPVGINLRTMYKLLDGSLPFIILLLAKIMYNHRLGILVLAGLYGTFCHANRMIKRQIAQRAQVSPVSQESQGWHSVLSIVWIIGFLSANILIIYYVFQEQQLYKSLLLQLPPVGQMDMWTLLWVTGITEFVIKFGAIILKAIVALLPRVFLPHKKRGKYYMVIEHISQFYRCIVPVLPWIAFLQDDQQGGQWFAVFLLIVYTIFKGQHLLRKVQKLRVAFSKFQVDVSYGSCPSGEELSSSDNSCPICQDKFNEPVKLSCKHIFCEDCVSMWFDRERTCPMCRANIVDDPVWRDGTTSGNMQLY